MSEHNSHAAGTYRVTCGNSPDHPRGNARGNPETHVSGLRSAAAAHLRRGRHLRPVPGPDSPPDQLDLFTAGCDEHGTPGGRWCALCLDQLPLFGGDPA